jgi:hypothetical protein
MAAAMASPRRSACCSVAQPVFVARRRLGRRHRVAQRGARGLPRLPCLRRPTPQRRSHAVAVQQCRMRRRLRQTHLIVLPLNLHQQRRRTPQQRHPDRLVVQIGAGLAVGRHHAAQHQLVLGVHAVLVQKCRQGLVVTRRETRRHAGLRRAAPHQPLLGPRAKRQAETIQQD